MNDKLAWGILSTGSIAGAFASALQRSTTGRLLAVASRTQEAADAFGDKFDAPKRYADYQSLLDDPEVQAVYIAPPHPMHAEWAIKAAEAGKHILCEKPLAMNYWQAMAVVEAAERNDVFLMEAFMYRCHPQTQRLVELLREKAIGEVRAIHATFSFNAGENWEGRLLNNALGGGGILDVGCYCTSMARLIAGVAQGGELSEPTEVVATGHVGDQSGVDEWTMASLKFPGGIVAQLATGVRLGMESVVHIYGTAGMIFIPSPWIISREGGASKIILTRYGAPPEEITIESQDWLYTIEADTVARHVKDRRAAFPAMTPQDTLGNMATLDRWRAAIGLAYAEDRDDSEYHKLPVHRRPLKPRADHEMQYGQLPGLDKPVSRLVIGVDNQACLSHASVMLDDFVEQGGNAFDTAQVYGNCEVTLGQWLRNRDMREQLVVISKGAHTPWCNPEDMQKHFDQSLERLQTDYLDVYLMHRDNPDIPVGEFIDLMNQWKAQGQVHVFGGSNWTIERMDEANAYAASKGLQGMGALSNNFSLARMVDAVWAGCIAASEPREKAWLEKTQTPLLAWSSQARGFFTDRAAPDKHDDPELDRCWYSDDNFQRRERAIELARKYDVLPINIALAYVLCQPFPSFALIGPRIPAETRTSLPGLKVKLTPEEVRWLNLETDSI